MEGLPYDCQIAACIAICKYEDVMNRAENVPKTFDLNQLWMMTMQARFKPASKTVLIWYKVTAT